MKYWQFLLCILVAQTANAQYPFDHKRDYQWIFGYGGGPGFGLSIVDFNHTAPDTLNLSDSFRYYVAQGNSSICDTSGILRFYTNGVALVNGSFEQIDSNSRLAMGSFGTFRYGTYSRDNSVTLPFGDGTDRIRVLHSSEFYDFLNIGGSPTSNNLWNTEIDLTANQGNGSILRLNQTILTDSFNLGGIVACRHANGRDWWVLLWKKNSSQVQRVLSTPYGVRHLGTQLTDSLVINSLGQSMFSPDGSRFAHFRSADGITSFLDLFDFDRCTGMLSNQRRHRLPNQNTSLLSCCFSPNSQLLYLGDAYKVYQINLAQPSSMIFTNIDTVAVNDGFIAPSGWATPLSYQQLAPNGKIYLGGGATQYLHTIHNPNGLRRTCDLRQHDFMMASTSSFGMPNHPHFRLGPLDGSVCDTLGIDMLPPVGIAPDPDPRGALVVYPNPTSGPLRLSWPAKQGKGMLVLTNMLGITLSTQTIDLSTGLMDLDTSGLRTGIYFYELKTPGVTTVPQKVSIIRD